MNWFGTRSGAIFYAVGLACVLTAASTSAWSAEELKAENLVDRLQIQDLITRYYNNFGKENAENFADFYADDAELILGERHFKGKDGIMQAYGRGPPQPDQPPRPPRPVRYSFIVVVGNPLIVVHGRRRRLNSSIPSMSSRSRAIRSR